MEEVLRIELFQASANYRKEETVDNKMTYPLPPFSTVIGALHSACGYQEYHPMEISIQGRYESLVRKPYTNHCFLNILHDDRGLLVKMANGDLLSTAYENVASVKKPTGSSFRKGVTIQVHNEKLLKEYRDLKDLSDVIKNFSEKRLKSVLEKIKQRKKTLSAKKAQLDKKSPEYFLVDKREKEIKDWEKELRQKVIDYEESYYKKPISRFRTLITSLSFYELLTNIELIIHIKSDRRTLEEIKSNIHNLKNIGRSEDFVEIKGIDFVMLQDFVEEEMESSYSSYIPYHLVREKDILLGNRRGVEANGTKYYLPKNYTIQDSKRIFEKKKVVYTSRFWVDEDSKHVYLDKKDKDKSYVVNFL